ALAVSTEQEALIQFFKGQIESAAAASTKAREAYERLGNALGRIRLLVLDAALIRSKGQLEEALRLHERAVATARELGDRAALEVALDRLGLGQSQAGLWQAAVSTYREVFRISVEDGRASGASIALANLAYMAGMMGDTRHSLRWSRRAIALVQRHWARVEGFAWRARA